MLFCLGVVLGWFWWLEDVLWVWFLNLGFVILFLWWMRFVCFFVCGIFVFCRGRLVLFCGVWRDG